MELQDAIHDVEHQEKSWACIALGQGTTGQSFSMYMCCLMTLQPLFTFGENILGLIRASEDDSHSEEDMGMEGMSAWADNNSILLGCYAEAGYAATHIILNPSSAEWPAERPRVWYVGIHRNRIAKMMSISYDQVDTLVENRPDGMPVQQGLSSADVPISRCHSAAQRSYFHWPLLAGDETKGAGARPRAGSCASGDRCTRTNGTPSE